jgi:hypothetical protein
MTRSTQDPFPDDVVWGEHMMGSALVPGVLMSVILGVAYTIDPHHEQEVREYLGTPLLCEYDALD